MGEGRKATDEDIHRIWNEIQFDERLRAMTDGELASELLHEVWAHLPFYSKANCISNEAIRRLKRADTLRRWNERKARRAARWPETIGD
jgi:hypothetical protein